MVQSNQTINADVIIIGAGPAGMEANKLALLQGLSPVVIESDEVGGTCLNRGCIPTKALCRSAEVADIINHASQFGLSQPEFSNLSQQYPAIAARKDKIVSELREGASLGFAKSRLVKGEARFTDSHTVEVGGVYYTAPKIIIASGSKPSRLPVEGASLAMTSDDILSMTSLPDSLCIVGGGVIGMEFASIMNSLGVNVSVIEYCPEILPNFDKEVGKRLRSLLSRKGIKFAVNSSVSKLYREDDGQISVVYNSKGKEAVTVASAVLMATGRSPVIPEGCREAGIAVGRRGIEVDPVTFETSVPGVYAVGDVNGMLMLAHVASAQASVVMGGKIDLGVVPSAVFTSPECAMVGLTEEQCRQSGIEYAVGKSLYRSNGKAMAMGETDGFVKVVSHKESGRLLGCHIIGLHASDLVQEIATAMVGSMTVSDIRTVIHAHPTLSELVSEACSK